jgi:rhodanese-related sulfurtransferase
MVKSVDVQTLRQWIEAGEAVVLDVREPAEHAAENIQGAELLPLGQVSTSRLPNHAGKKLVIHCRSGMRGSRACEQLLSENPGLEVYNLEGGIAAWGQAGHPVNVSGKKLLPLDRQVQLAIGLLLLTGSVLGYLFSPMWFLLTGFIGLGLSVAGLTGFCGLALLIAKMPWNQKGNTSMPSCCSGSN